MHIVSAWAAEAHLLLGQVTVDEKSNEITAIPKLLGLQELHGAMVTIDALGCQKDIAAKFREGGGDYVLAVKGNQEHLEEVISNYFALSLVPLALLEAPMAGCLHGRHEGQAVRGDVHRHFRRDRRQCRLTDLAGCSALAECPARSVPPTAAGQDGRADGRDGSPRRRPRP